MTLIQRAAAPRIGQAESESVVDGIVITSTSTVGMERTELPVRDQDYEVERDRVLTKTTSAGVEPLSLEETKEHHSEAKKLLDCLAKKGLRIGGNITSFPIALTEYRSYLERVADMFSFLVGMYIKRAIEEDDARRRLAMITTGVIASLHTNMNPKMVFDPILGETYIGRWENGAEIFAEQVSHSPSISAFQIYDSDETWRCCAQVQFEVKSSVSVMEVFQHGIFMLELSDGSRFQWEFPSVTLSGVFEGNCVVKVTGSLAVTDVVNKLQASVDFGLNKGCNYDTELRATSVHGGIGSARETKNGSWELCGKDYDLEITGDYCKEVLIGGELAFAVESDIARRPMGTVYDADLLPSDSRMRPDRCLLIHGNNEAADKVKIALEAAQRNKASQRKRPVVSISSIALPDGISDVLRAEFHTFQESMLQIEAEAALLQSGENQDQLAARDLLDEVKVQRRSQADARMQMRFEVVEKEAKMGHERVDREFEEAKATLHKRIIQAYSQSDAHLTSQLKEMMGKEYNSYIADNAISFPPIAPDIQMQTRLQQPEEAHFRLSQAEAEDDLRRIRDIYRTDEGKD